MDIFKENRTRKIIISILILAVVAGIVFLGIFYRADIQGFLETRVMAKKKSEPPREVGIVDYDKLIKDHPDYDKLQRYDEEIARYGPNPFDPTMLKELNDELGKKMEKFSKDMTEKLKAEQAKLESQAKQESDTYRKQYETVAAKKMKEFSDFQDKLRQQYEKHQSDPNRPLSDFEKEYIRRVNQKTQDLRALKAQMIKAKELELTNKSRDKVQQETARLEKVIAAYEDEVLKGDQNEKINLQMQVQTAQDDEEREKFQTQLNALFKSEEDKVNARRAELNKELEGIRSGERKKIDQDMARYEAKLERDFAKQIAPIKDKVLAELRGEGKKPGSAPANPSIPKDIQDKLEAKRAQIQKEMRTLENEMKGKVNAILEQAKERFEASKKQFTKKLQAYHQELAKEFEEKKNEMVSQQMAANDQKKKAWEEMKEARNRKYKKMLEDINRQVEIVAKENNVKMVIGSYRVNIEGVDLNEQAMKAVRQLKSE